MRRTLALFGAGAALGAVAMYVVHGDGAGPLASAAAPVSGEARETPGARERVPRSIDFLTLATGSVGSTERAALFRLAAEADRRTLETLAEQVAALPNVEGRRIALEALLTRYAELDAPAAAAFARTLGLPPAVVKPLYTTWVRRDSRAALSALGELDARPALTLGVAMLEAIGNDDLGIARVLGAAPQLDPDRFRIEAAIAKAAEDPAAALESILALPPSKAATALERLAALWVERDVQGALAAAEEVADESLRNQLRGAVMRAWTYTDPEALLDYVLELEPERRNEALRTGGLQAFAAVDPQRALRAAEGLPGELGSMLKRTALMSIARDDPLTAISLVEALPAGEREMMLGVIASSYGRTDPEAALLWAQSLNPPSPNAVGNVLAGLARVDPDRAIELAFETMDATNQRGPGPLVTLVSNGSLNAEQTARLADRLLATPSRSQALQMLAQAWAQRQPQDAARWMLAKGSGVPRSALGQAALHLARVDPAAAIAYVDRVSPDLRATWLSAVADGYAQNDVRAAASWIAQHRGEPGYDAALGAIAARTATSDPPAAARLFDSINPAEAPDASQTAARITQEWARRDHRAAAGWAATVADDNVRTAAVGTAAAQWAARDAPGARGWVLGMATGATRDAAVTQLLGATTASTIDHVLVDAYSNAEARQRGVSDAVRMIAFRDTAAARQLADQYLTDPGARQAAERFIEQGRNGTMYVGPPPPRLPPGR
jgi:GrpB-like predicted nucleotidyltransferase (UPF0157 family)